MDTHLPIIILIYLLFALGAFILELRNVLRSNKITIIFMCRILYIVSLMVLPALIYWGHLLEVRSTIIRYEDNLVWTFYVQFILTVIGYLMMNFGYRVKQRQIRPKEQLSAYRITTSAVIFLIISAVSLVLWASAYGGIATLLENAEWIRAGAVEAQNSFTFFKHFVPISMLASYLLFYLLLTKVEMGTAKKLFTVALLVVAMALSALYLQAHDGRLLLVTYVLLFFLLYFRHQSEQKQVSLRKLLPKTVPVLIIGVLILFNADAILNWLRGTEEDSVTSDSWNFFNTVTKEFSFIVAGTQKAIMEAASGEGKLMIVNDVVDGLFAWFPTALKPIEVESVWTYNTQLITPGATATNPTSMVAQSVYDLGFLGILVIPMFFGMLVKKVERILDSYGDNVFVCTVYAALGFNLCRMTAYFSLYTFMIETFYIFLGIVIYSVLQRVKYK